MLLPSDWWPDKWPLHAPSGRGPFPVPPHLPLYRRCSSALTSLKWCGLVWQWTVVINQKKQKDFKWIPSAKTNITLMPKRPAKSKQVPPNYFKLTHPGTPPASIWLANVTSCDHTSYCHFWSPITPHRTFPECTPTRMLMSTPVASRTFLSYTKKNKTDFIIMG